MDIEIENEEDKFPKITTKDLPYTATELAKLKKESDCTPKESETEYVWRVSLSGGDHILPSEKEAKGYWGPGVSLTPGDHHAPLPSTQRAAYWAGGLNPLKTRDPFTITRRVDQLIKNVQKVVCLQMMYNRELKQESPVMILVYPELKNSLFWVLLNTLKTMGTQLQGKTQAMSQSERAVAALEGLLLSG